jgi:NADH:ubiquinone oxidoreductase subunit
MQFKKSIIQAIKPDKPQGILIGELNGDTFHEWFDPRAPPDQLPRRYVEYKDNNNPTPNNIHELWDLWLRHAVWDPPTRDDIDKYELRRNKYLSRVKMMEERDEKVRLEEQLQRKLGSEMGKGVYKGDVNKGSTKQDPMEGVKEFLSGLEQELKQQQDDMKQSAEMFGGGGGGGGSGKNGENQQYEDVTNTWDPTKSRKFDF